MDKQEDGKEEMSELKMLDDEEDDNMDYELQKLRDELKDMEEPRTITFKHVQIVQPFVSGSTTTTLSFTLGAKQFYDAENAIWVGLEEFQDFMNFLEFSSQVDEQEGWKPRYAKRLVKVTLELEDELDG